MKDSKRVQAKLGCRQISEYLTSNNSVTKFDKLHSLNTYFLFLNPCNSPSTYLCSVVCGTIQLSKEFELKTENARKLKM